MLTEGKVKKAYQLLRDNWTYGDIRERLDITQKEVYAIELLGLREVEPWKAFQFIQTIPMGTESTEIYRIIDEYKPLPPPQYFVEGKLK